MLIPHIEALVALLVLTSTFSIPGVRADTAVLPSGEQINGSLGALPDGRLTFVRSDQKVELRPQELEYVRFPAKPRTPLRAASIHRILLRDGQQLTGELSRLDEREVRFRTAWKDGFVIPRSAVLAITQPPGDATFLVDDFEAGLAGWSLTGAPQLSNRCCSSGRGSLCLDQPGQTAEVALAAPLEKGKVGINFCEQGRPAGAHWLVQATFDGTNGKRDVLIVVAGEGPCYRAQVAGATSELAARPGWHRLLIEFASRSLSVAIDEDILWFGRQTAPGGRLKSIRLSCTTAGNTINTGEVFFDDFSIAQALPSIPRPPGDPHQDEIWLRSGDQLFGNIAAADQRAIDLGFRSTRRSVKWGDARAIYLRNAPAAPPPNNRERIRVWLHSGAGAEPDQLEGSLRQFNDKHLVLHHENLGELTIDVPYVHRLKWLPKP
jgi:hypothetical protein